ncbi:hypothetical protein SDRG_15751 [Saprolegnia diclina VS20]|uniref:FYVE-type domain-containing protein n=1 Tax=Saprolegnia diclina (strain VS20) TaxID=1156394 RepID=T0PVX3_SAPDV|nr:hypothetical protein SDRG_15751 [Saprolegnia diclina VS20]EQC26406.1 hypothetical protein SDRG_15751 [Saprolegnia diclina VS20]|eukprot:XP_008620155.1 hypothetical protein SDRG_15751 [Saprolegnia diclina VS20]
MATYPRMAFSPEAYAKHMANLDSVLQQALSDHIAWHEPTIVLDSSWARPLDKNGWRIFAQTSSSAAKATYVCTGRLHTNLDALRAAIYNERTPAYRSNCAVLYEGALVDAAVLNVSQRRSPTDAGHFLGVKVLKLAISPVVGDLDTTQHDFVFVEYAGTRRDRHGRETYFVISEPMTDPTKPKGASSSKESLATVKLYRTADDGSVAVTVRAVIRFAPKAKKQQASTMVLWKDMGVYLPRSLTKDFLSVTREAFAYQALLLTTGSFAPTLSKNTKMCSVCTKSSSLLRRHGHCQRCGHAMCSACTVKLYCVDRPSRKLSDKLMVQEKFCKQCFVEAKTLRLRSDYNTDDVASVHSSNGSVIYIDDPMHASYHEGQVSRSGSVVNSVVGSTCSSHDDTYSSSSMGSVARKGSVASSATTWTSSVKDEALPRKVSAADARASARQGGRPARRGSLESQSIATTSSSWSSLTKEEMALRIDEMHESIAHQTYLITSMNEMLVQPRPARGYGASGGNPYVYHDHPTAAPLGYHDLPPAGYGEIPRPPPPRYQNYNKY